MKNIICNAAAFIFATILPMISLGETAPTPSSQAPVAKVVVIEKLMQPLPDGLRVFVKIAQQMDREFSMQIGELERLSRQAAAAFEAAQRNPADQTLAAQSKKLVQEHETKKNDLTKAASRRQKFLVDPVFKQIEASVLEYSNKQAKGQIILVNADQLQGRAPESIEDVTPAFVVWMNEQP